MGQHALRNNQPNIKFVKFEQVSGFLPSLVKKSKTLSPKKKKGSRIHKECLNKCFWPKILSTNTLGTIVHKMYESDKNQVTYYNVI
jgi:hypothetical protein